MDALNIDYQKWVKVFGEEFTQQIIMLGLERTKDLEWKGIAHKGQLSTLADTKDKGKGANMTTAQERIAEIYKNLRILEDIAEKGMLPDSVIEGRIAALAAEMNEITRDTSQDATLVESIKSSLRIDSREAALPRWQTTLLQQVHDQRTNQKSKGQSLADSLADIK